MDVKISTDNGAEAGHPMQPLADAQIPVIPGMPNVSGVYIAPLQHHALLPEPPHGAPPDAEAAAGIPLMLRRERLRLDVDGRYPQMKASGTLVRSLGLRRDWIAELSATGANSWSGPIFYKDGATTLLPHTNVSITVKRSIFMSQRRATIVFSGGGAPDRTVKLNFSSGYYHPVELEFDAEQGTSAVTQIDTAAHPNHPASIPAETLTIQEVFQRAGFNATLSTGANAIPSSSPGANMRWSDAEMHDAMQAHWSRFSNRPKWALWVLFASSLHDIGSTLGGVMFDDIGPNHRQGTAIFNNAFIANPPAGDANPAAWVARMRFWTACHEMGHAFNLAHSWQKSLGAPWIPLADEPEARSFMNYPFRVSGGQSAFFSDFEFRFSDAELTFLRHAPAQFVQMGNADWFDHHGFREAAVSPEPGFQLELRVNRAKPEFEFLEPAMVELKLKNISREPKIIDDDLLKAAEHLVVIIKKQGKPARRWAPYAQYCWHASRSVLGADKSVYEPLFLSAGRNGWDLAEPGVYTVQVALEIAHGEEIVSNPLQIRVAPPRGYDEEYLAQDFFSDEVGRALAFDGTQVLTAANDALSEVVNRLPKRKVATHAQVALCEPLSRDYRTLAYNEGAKQRTVFQVTRAKSDEAKRGLSAALLDDCNAAAETLGHIEYKYYVDRLTDWLHERGDSANAAKGQQALRGTLQKRKVADWVIASVDRKLDSYGRNNRKSKR
jgi:hypothetical protein